jgi:hypothetical protein
MNGLVVGVPQLAAECVVQNLYGCRHQDVWYHCIVAGHTPASNDTIVTIICLICNSVFVTDSDYCPVRKGGEALHKVKADAGPFERNLWNPLCRNLCKLHMVLHGAAVLGV